MRRTINFTKMEGAGNDFVVINALKEDLSKDQLVSITPQLCERRFGIGADGLLAIARPEIEKADFQMIYRNTDGSDAGMCGNGGRCISKFASINGFNFEHYFHVHQEVYKAQVNESEGIVIVDFPMHVQVKQLELDDKFSLYEVFTGTDHIVIPVSKEDFNKKDRLFELGRRIRYDEKINPRGTNVNFIFKDDKGLIHMDTYERGVENFTLACGTGALASGILAHHLEKKNSGNVQKEIVCRGGILETSFYESNAFYSNISLKGEANIVFEGTINIEV